MNIKRYPEDILDNTIGIKLPMNGSDKKLFNMSFTTEDQAVSNYINLLLTRPGERYMQPNFGIGIQLYLFEPNTDILRIELERVIWQQSAFWLPYIRNKSIEVKPKSDLLGNDDPENAIQIIITFSVTENGANKQIVIFQSGGRTNYRIAN